MSDSQTLVFKAVRSAYLVAGIVFGSLTLLTGLADISDKSIRTFFFLCLGCWIFSYVWLARFRLVSATESLSYRSLFGGTRTYRMLDIRRITKEVGFREYSDRFKPHVRLVIRPHTEISRFSVYVNLRVFGKPGARQILDDLQIKFNAIGKPEVVKHLKTWR